MHERGDDFLVFHHSQLTGARYGSGIDEDFCSITTTGRRTGNPHCIEIWFAARGGRTIFGESEGAATARVVEPGTDEDALARRLLLAKYQVATSDDLESWGRSALPVAFDLGW